ncbi:alpha/beta hydrolase [Planctomicrobium piriforme]|uniref:Lysophospholipase, alpha-beta hydrolase superfamily n=1 Tax=Planctomicrobium piriforme TaxID=1576369 RepID=A0A1I3QCS1_9PLAN|nr:alpha/beta fold hydrolase [Planctomicrobium piriforme]SFJ31510.1 Lysophospholipase, alpha-beta hydrolase superfamily [Planctomicrobium piriforme]
MTPTLSIRRASDGYDLHYRHWRPAGVPKGYFLWLHGIQSHSGWYESSCEQLATAGYDVRFPDRRGSGLNAAPRGHAPHWERLTSDVRHFLNDIHADQATESPTAPVFLCGISWGAKVATAIAAQTPGAIDALILVTPGLFPKIGPNAWDRARLALARALDIRDRQIPIPLNDPALFTSVPEQQQRIANDPLALHEVTLPFLFAGQDLDRIARTTHALQMPLRLLLAEQDQIIDNEETLQHLHHICGSNLSVKTYPKVRHTLELETCREAYVADLVTWADGFVSR